MPELWLAGAARPVRSEPIWRRGRRALARRDTRRRRSARRVSSERPGDPQRAQPVGPGCAAHVGHQRRWRRHQRRAVLRNLRRAAGKRHSFLRPVWHSGRIERRRRVIVRRERAAPVWPGAVPCWRLAGRRPQRRHRNDAGRRRTCLQRLWALWRWAGRSIWRDSVPSRGQCASAVIRRDILIPHRAADVRRALSARQYH